MALPKKNFQNNRVYYLNKCKIKILFVPINCRVLSYQVLTIVTSLLCNINYNCSFKNKFFSVEGSL